MDIYELVGVGKEEITEYLDELRESGTINMFGAASHLREYFGFSRKESDIILKDWMGI